MQYGSPSWQADATGATATPHADARTAIRGFALVASRLRARPDLRVAAHRALATRLLSRRGRLAELRSAVEETVASLLAGSAVTARSLLASSRRAPASALTPAARPASPNAPNRHDRLRHLMTRAVGTALLT
jgi:hypothetical protein